jgi:hypothetical protein
MKSLADFKQHQGWNSHLPYSVGVKIINLKDSELFMILHGDNPIIENNQLYFEVNRVNASISNFTVTGRTFEPIPVEEIQMYSGVDYKMLFLKGLHLNMKEEVSLVFYEYTYRKDGLPKVIHIPLREENIQIC